MDIKVITRHAPFNYGSLLQSMATLKIVRRLGHKCCIIDYIRDDEYGLKSILMSLDRKKEWNNNFLKKLLYVMLRYPEEYWAQRRFAHMRMKYLEMTLRYRSIVELSTLKADIFMTGSDQVWGPVLTANYDETYFLSFVNNGAKKVSYAASFGKTSFNNQIMSAYRKLLSDYDAITVRENAAVNLLHQMDISCVGQVLDPTLLLDKNIYIDDFKLVEDNEKYIFVYMLYDDNKRQMNKVIDLALELSKNKKLKVKYVYMNKIKKLKDAEFVLGIGPKEFLEMIYNAEYVITNSFHATVFSILFEKSFCVIKRIGSQSRMIELLHMIEMEKNLYSDSTSSWTMSKVQDNNILLLDTEKKKSRLFLEKALEITID